MIYSKIKDFINIKWYRFNWDKCCADKERAVQQVIRIGLNKHKMKALKNHSVLYTIYTIITTMHLFHIFFEHS